MISGQLILSGITDKQMVMIFQAKEKSGGKLIFLPMNLQVQQVPGHPTRQTYTNVSIHWVDDTGAKAAATLLSEILDVSEV